MDAAESAVETVDAMFPAVLIAVLTASLMELAVDNAVLALDTAVEIWFLIPSDKP